MEQINREEITIQCLQGLLANSELILDIIERPEKVCDLAIKMTDHIIERLNNANKPEK